MTENYFSFLELPFHVDVNEKILRQRFLEKSKEFHPDYNQSSSESMHYSALLNKAYQTLQSLSTRIEYILLLKNVIQNDEKYVLDNEFLMDMMEYNELLTDIEHLQEASRYIQLSKTIREVNNTLEKSMVEILKNINLNEDILSETKEKLKELFYKQKYILRIIKRLNTFAAQ